MSLDDLDLEFEDEEEKKSDAVSVDVDLEFGTDTNVGIQKPSPVAGGKPIAKPQAISPKPGTPTQAAKPSIVAKTPVAESNVRPITPKPAAALSNAASEKVTPRVAAVSGSSALQVEPESVVGDQNDLVALLQNRIEQVELDAQIKIAVAEFKTDILSDLLSDIKLLEHQIGGLLGRIHTKHPDLKQEVLMIKKLLSDFSNKKRK